MTPFGKSMKKIIAITILLAALVTTIYFCLLHNAKSKADVYMRPLLERGWHAEVARVGHEGWNWGWSFTYYRGDGLECFPPSVAVTWSGRVLGNDASRQYYVDRYDAWAQGKMKRTETDSAVEQAGEAPGR